MDNYVEITWSALSKKLEVQLNNYGFTLGEKADKWQKLYDSIIILHVHDIVTDAEYKRIRDRFCKRMTNDLQPIGKEVIDFRNYMNSPK